MIKALQKLREKAVFLRSLQKRVMQLELAQRRMVHVQRETLRCKAMLKRLEGQPIHVAFVCHSPSLWGKLSPVWKSLRSDPDFEVSLIAVPYKHVSFGDSDYHDGGMADFLRREEGVEPICGRDPDTGEWLDLQEISPDFVFFQTPYDSQFPFQYKSECVSAYARVCYVPYYGMLLYKGEVEDITHPVGFFRNVSLALVGTETEAAELRARFGEILGRQQVVVAGFPMTDYTLSATPPSGAGWNLERTEGVKRVLWTPRWRTQEGNCHFFDYKDYFLKMARDRDDLDFLFRPHPLCLKNFLQRGEFPQADQDAMLKAYDELPNAGIDESGDYRDIFLSSDILVSDMSSMMGEYFVTGKPIVYTHRVDTFNELGAELARGFYWVRNQAELDETLNMLLTGDDPLKETRKEILEKMFPVPEGGASGVIKEVLRARFMKDAGERGEGGVTAGAEERARR